MSADKDNPPGNWAGAIAAGHDVYYAIDPSDGVAIVWHWCPSEQRWSAAGTRDHTMVSREPLTLSPSLQLDCCDFHGFLRDGQWTPV
jgi:hypothetical protein